MEIYKGVRGKKNVARIEKAIEASGGAVLRRPKPDEAPFVFFIQAPSGEELTLVCYAFTANEYKQGGRPKGEHRFQVKYGSEFDRPHSLHIDPARKQVTLMFGVHDTLDLFVAVDPAMHNPTWFSSSIEFKKPRLNEAKRSGWHGWERERVAAGRRQVLPLEDLRTEILIAFKPEHFLTYAMFERLATDMDPGERLLLSDQIEDRLISRKPVADLVRHLPETREEAAQHPLLQQLGLSNEELMNLLGARFRLLAAVRGSVAEHHLGKFLSTVPGVKDVKHLDKDGEPDFELRYKSGLIRIECKNVLRRLVNKAPRVDFQKTRAAKGNPCSRYYEPRQFEILGACLHPITQKWEFQFCLTSTLTPHSKCPGRLSEKVQVASPNWTAQLPALLNQLL